MEKKTAHKLTGLVILVLGILFFLRDIDPVRLNFIGNTSGWTIIIVLVGASLLAGGVEISKLTQAKSGKSRTKTGM